MTSPRERLQKLRKICLSFPEAAERLSHGHPAFFVGKRMFAMAITATNDVLSCNAPYGEQKFLVESDPNRYYVPPYSGYRGWIAMRLHGRVDWIQVREHAEESYRMVAPKRLVATLDANQPSTRSNST